MYLTNVPKCFPFATAELASCPGFPLGVCNTGGGGAWRDAHTLKHTHTHPGDRLGRWCLFSPNSMGRPLPSPALWLCLGGLELVVVRWETPGRWKLGPHSVGSPPGGPALAAFKTGGKAYPSCMWPRSDVPDLHEGLQQSPGWL